MRNYYRIMLGKKSIYAEEAKAENFIGADSLGDVNLTDRLRDNWREFNKEMIPIWLTKNPNKTKVAAGLSCGYLWTVCRGMLEGDRVICPDGSGNYFVGEVISPYYFVAGDHLPHRRQVKWIASIARSDMSQSLQYSTGSIGTVANVSKYSDELDRLVGDMSQPVLIATDETIEDPSIFALEKHLEDFLVQNWKHTELGKKYDIYTFDGEIVGQQYPSDTGPIDILAVSKDHMELLVVELKKGRASDVVVGQIQRYMGYVQDELAENNQLVSGVIIAFEDDVRLSRALSVTKNIDFMTYKVNFSLQKYQKRTSSASSSPRDIDQKTTRTDL